VNYHPTCELIGELYAPMYGELYVPLAYLIGELYVPYLPLGLAMKGLQGSYKQEI